MKRIISICALIAAVLSFCVTLPVCSLGESLYPLVLTDQTGREVRVEAQPERVVSGYYISTSAIIALDGRGMLVGVEAKADQRNIYRLVAPELIALPNVGSAKEFDLEGCLALNPDLVILPQKLKSAAETITSFGIPVLLVNPEDQPSLHEMIALLGRALNRESRADALLADLRDKESWLESALAGTVRPRVYIASNSSFLSTAGSGMYQSDLIVKAGGENAASGLTGSYWQEISYEQLLAWDPDVILLPSDAAYTVQDVLEDPNLADMTAIQSGSVYRMPNDYEAWDSPVPGGILGAVWLASEIHGDIVSADACDEMVKQFYETFYECTGPENG